MKLQSQISRKVGDVEYRKSWVVIPNKILKELEWREKEDLIVEIENNKLVIKKDKSKSI